MIKDIILSFFDITKNIIFARKAKVLFYYPQHFNRSAEGTNPFFDSMLQACEKNGIPYKLIEEPDGGTDKPRNKKAVKGDFLFWTIIVIRKVVGILFRQSDFYTNEKRVASVLNVITLGRLRYNTYITISGSMFHLLPNLKKSSKVYDMQHGILYKGHYVFFDQQHDRKLYPQFYPENLNWLFWGTGYRDGFVRGEETILTHKCYVVGYPMSSNSQLNPLRYKEILVSLQFTADWDMVKLGNIKQMIILMLEELKGKGIKVLLKHHPRYNNVIDISDIYTQFDFVEETKESIKELLPKTLLQVTFNSTTAFEFAEVGIPSWFLSDETYPLSENLFYEEYKYPLYKDMNIAQVVERLQNPSNFQKDAKVVKDWYNKFYTTFNEQEFLKIIR